MRTLARFPDQGSLTRLPVELATQLPAARAAGPKAPHGETETAPREPVGDHLSAAAHLSEKASSDLIEEVTDGGVDDVAVDDAAEDADRPQASAGGRVAAFFITLLAPPRRRKPPKKIGWGSIAFLTMISVGVWTLAWWQSREETKRPWDHVTERVASQPSTTVDGAVR